MRWLVAKVQARMEDAADRRRHRWATRKRRALDREWLAWDDDLDWDAPGPHVAAMDPRQD